LGFLTGSDGVSPITGESLSATLQPQPELRARIKRHAALLDASLVRRDYERTQRAVAPSRQCADEYVTRLISSVSSPAPERASLRGDTWPLSYYS